MEIRTDKEYGIMLDAVRLHHKKILARKENLAGTYWKAITHGRAPYLTAPVNVRYSFVTDPLGMTAELTVEKSCDGIRISTSKSGVYFEVLDDKKQTVSCISQKEFKKETAPLIREYGLQWLESEIKK